MSGSSDKQTSTTSSLWAPQGAALSTAFNGATAAYNKAKGATAPTDFTAQFTPDQLATFKSMLRYSTGNTLPQTAAGTANALQTAGTSATTGALSNLNTFDPTKTNNPQTLIDNANQYMQGQNIDGQVNDAMLNARQTARDVTMPGIEQNAAMTGNTNSSRTGIAEGLVQRGLAQQATNLGASMRGQAFRDGLGLAASNANANNASRLGALSTAAGAGTNAANSGVNAGSTSINDQGSLYSMAGNAGAGEQASNQADLNNQLQRYQNQQSGSFTPLQNLMSVIGTNNWAPSTSGTEHTTSTPSAWSVLGGLLGAAGSGASGAGGLGWKPFGK